MTLLFYFEIYCHKNVRENSNERIILKEIKSFLSLICQNSLIQTKIKNLEVKTLNFKQIKKLGEKKFQFQVDKKLQD
jgi:hypothetical protein